MAASDAKDLGSGEDMYDELCDAVYEEGAMKALVCAANRVIESAGGDADAGLTVKQAMEIMSG